MSSIDLFILWCGWVLTTASPGPATLSIISCAMSNGRLPAIFLALGIITGGVFWGILAAIGVSALMLNNAWIMEIFRLIGASYLMYLAYRSFKNAIACKPVQLSTAAPSTPLHRQYFHGLLIHTTNPKPILAWAAVFALISSPSVGLSSIASVFLILTASSSCIFLGYALAFSSQILANYYTRIGRYLKAGFAVFFGVASIKLLTSRVFS